MPLPWRIMQSLNAQRPYSTTLLIINVLIFAPRDFHGGYPVSPTREIAALNWIGLCSLFRVKIFVIQCHVCCSSTSMFSSACYLVELLYNDVSHQRPSICIAFLVVSFLG